MSVRGTLCKFAVTAVLAAAAAVAVPTTAVAHSEAPQPSSASGLATGAASVGLFGPKLAWLEAFSRSNG
ncbi:MULTISPECIES: hypothetical protein [unclassified Kitasatospora]|uniref:hypothetical protein n=1 Tax=unclassified Kitasatospora TaxID=2633591 RepID=UPI001ADFDC40|nr:hypothetical protein [Kitasatospora sp. RG8]MBP0450863.1 hypothetical protein [Kitasatospora sp. RG8]